MIKCIIAAIGDRNELGVKGNLPWHISGDLKYFKSTTLGCPVIMGRTTYDSLPFKPLKGRTNIVLSRRDISLPGVVCVKNVEDAFSAACPADRCFVMGGASVYKETMDMVDELYITHVHAIVADADVFFPEIDPDVWNRTSVSETFVDEESGYNFEFAVYKRKG